jgi:hypothetical protein
MSWAAVATLGANVAGGLLQKKTGEKNSQNAEDMAAADKTWYADEMAKSLRANRPNQETPFGNSTWTQDEKGNWTQKMTLDPQDQERLGQFRQMAGGRMTAANQQDMSRYAKGIDYNAIGLGHLNAAAGGTGTTGKSPWADNAFSSSGGEYLNQFNQQPRGMQHTMGGNAGFGGGLGAGNFSDFNAAMQKHLQGNKPADDFNQMFLDAGQR